MVTSQRNPSETSSYKLLLGLAVTILQPLGTCLHYLFFTTPSQYPGTIVNAIYLNQECQYPSQTNTDKFKVFSSGFKSANLKALYKQVILAIPGRKISVSSAKPRGWLSPIAQLVTVPQQLCFSFKSKGTVWAKWGAPGAMNLLLAQRERFLHKCFVCYWTH